MNSLAFPDRDSLRGVERSRRAASEAEWVNISWYAQPLGHASVALSGELSGTVHAILIAIRPLSMHFLGRSPEDPNRAAGCRSGC